MHGRVAVVTDSSASLPRDAAKQWGVTVVPLKIKIGDRIEDERMIGSDELIAALKRHQPTTTTPPDPAAFFRTYQQLAASGVTAVVSVHISARQSRTCEFAQQAAARAGIPVHVVDSATTGMSLGYAALAGARVAGAGGNPRRVLDATVRRLRGSSELIYVETLDYLRRGGRIGGATRFVGTALAMKPILTMRDGQVAPLDRVIGAERALRRMVDTAVSRAGDSTVDIAVQHFGALPRAVALLEQLRRRLPRAREAEITEVSSAIGLHVGPGSIGISISPA